MQLALILALCILTQPPADKKPTKRDNPKTAIKAVLEEASDLYKTQIKAYQSAKTSADKTNVLDAAKTRFEEWAETIDELPVSFESRVIDVTKSKTTDTYYAVFEQGKDLQKFSANTVTPTIAARKFFIEITEEQSKTIKIGNRLTITGTISPSMGYVIDQQGNPNSTDPQQARQLQPPPGIVCLFMLNYSPAVFTQQNFNYYEKPVDFVTFLLDDATIQFDE